VTQLPHLSADMPTDLTSPVVALLLVLTPLLPLLLAPFARRTIGRWGLVLGMLPALLAAVWVPVGSRLDLSWVLLGVHLGLDTTGRAFLLFSSVVWLAAALFALTGPERRRVTGRFGVFFQLALAGNLLLILAADILTFYVGFALMGLSAYGLVLGRSQCARRAARLYLGFTLVGELALFSALVLLATAAGSPRFDDLAGVPMSDAAIMLLLLGFGIKVALPGLHPWLPLTYTAAPLAAVVVLSGPMMKAGLLGWLRFLPPGTPGLEPWGAPLLVLGALGVVLGTLLGVLQRNPRAVLAYSSIAKMGLISALFGSALAQPVLAEPLLAALLLFALHHLLVKPALFLGVGAWEASLARPWLLAGLGLLAASLCGLPLTGGDAAKQALKAALGGQVGLLLVVSAAGTLLLMLRFLYLLVARESRAMLESRAPLLIWAALLPIAFWGPFWPTEIALSIDGLGPLALGAALAAAAWRLSKEYPGLSPRIAPGDLYHWAVRWRVTAPLLAWRGAPNLGIATAWSAALRPRRDRATLTGVGLVLLTLIALLLGSLMLT